MTGPRGCCGGYALVASVLLRQPGIALPGLLAGLFVVLAVVGAGDSQGDGNWTASAIVGDRLGNNVIFYLWFIPLTTAAIAWAAAAATARVRSRPAVTAAFGAAAPPLVADGR
jgi:hypothetical protein